MSKEGLQSVIGAGTTDQADVSTEDLRDLFSLRGDTISDTHDTLNCKCLERSMNIDDVKNESDITTEVVLKEPAKSQVDEPKEEDLENWAHHPTVESLDDEAFRESHPKTLNLDNNFVSFIFTCHVSGMLVPELSKPKPKPTLINSLSSSRALQTSRTPISSSNPISFTASLNRKPLGNLSLQPTPMKIGASITPKPLSSTPSTLNTSLLVSKPIVFEKPKSKSPPKIIMTTTKHIDNKENLSTDSLPHSSLMNLTCDEDNKPKFKNRLLKKSKPNYDSTAPIPHPNDFVDLIELD